MSRTFSIQSMYGRFRDDLFFVGYVLLFFNVMISTYINFDDSLADRLHNLTRVLYILFLGVCILCLILRQTYGVKEILSIGGLLIIGAITYFITGTHIIFDFTLIIAIAKNIDFEKFIKRAMALFALFLLAMIFLSCLDIISPVVKERSDNTQMRNSLGFGHPNALGIMVFQLVAAVIVLERKKLKTIHLWLLLCLGVIIYFISRSQSCLIGVCLLVFAALIYKWLARKVMTPRQMKIFISLVLSAALIAAVFAVRYYWINPGDLPFSTLAGRISMVKKYLNAYGVNFFGHDILIGSEVALPGYAEGYSYLDNGEIRYLIEYGILGCAVFFYTYVRMIIKTINTREFVLCIVAVVYLVYSLAEYSALTVALNFMIVYAGISIYSGNLLKSEMFERRSRKRKPYISPSKGMPETDYEQIN